MSPPIESDLSALQSLPSSTLARLIDPAAAAEPGTPPDPHAELAAFDPKTSTVQGSVSASRAYVKEMRRAAEELKSHVIGTMERDVDGERLERIRDEAEVVRAAVTAYAADVKIAAKCECWCVQY